ncbi:DUF7738 domain-containing protein [Duganella aceris]|uniref:DUF7738 domain-containing protein n=1 Tax=Duganella aceris TaxID=2703883 RepID=A0ABX0FK51_9BURK|nr:hypothetical protein [Duganella aceris]NGZ84942.1 hypothetical protein [Duganella aceris]
MSLLPFTVLFAVANVYGQDFGDRVGSAFDKAAKQMLAVKDYGLPRKIAKVGKPALILKDGRISLNDRRLVLGDSMQSWKKIIGDGSVCGEQKWPKWCKWEALGIAIGTSMKRDDRVEYVTVYLNKDPSQNEVDFPDLDKNGKPVPHPWIVEGLFPGYLELDGFGIDRKTQFWEIRSSVNRTRDLRCGLRDCSHPVGALSETVGIFIKLTGNHERAELRELSLSLGEDG